MNAARTESHGNDMMNAYRFRRFRTGTMALALGLALAACGGENAPGAGESREAGGELDVGMAPAPASAPAARGDTIDLRSIGYSRGAEDAVVTVYEFSDFGCPFCALFAQGTYPELHEEFVATGKVRWTYVPFVMGMFPNGAEAARASECAAEQDRFWEMHDLLYAKQREWKASGGEQELFAGYAAELGLEGERFASCYEEDRGGARTETNNQVSQALGIRATPTFVVNGRLVEGALPVEQFRQILAMLAEEG